MNLRFQKFKYRLKNYSIIEVSGEDRETFLQGQLTNDIKNEFHNSAFLNTRLNSSGKIQFAFYTLKNASHIFLVIPNSQREALLNDLNKFIIMDDVELKVLNAEIYFLANTFNENGFKGVFAGIGGQFCFEDKTNLIEIDESKLSDYFLMSGYPNLVLENYLNKFINETRFNDLAISYKKGCFLGQETVAKIQNNRGAAYTPMILESDKLIKDFLSNEIFDINNSKIGIVENVSTYANKHYYHCLVTRDFKVTGKKITEKSGVTFVVRPYPFFKVTFDEVALELYDLSIEKFHANKIDEALLLVNLSLNYKKTPDALEVKGVMLGRISKYEEAILVMNELQLLDPKSVMAHTNKSLYLMNLGKIAEAEEEKSLATVKSFEKFGEEAKIKKQIELEKKKKEEEVLNREKMFLKVLEIDSDDEIANFGLADINLNRGKYIDALVYINKALENNPQYSAAYLLKGKVEEALCDSDAAKETYIKGIGIATKKGDMMPANEMQTRLNKI